MLKLKIHQRLHLNYSSSSYFDAWTIVESTTTASCISSIWSSHMIQIRCILGTPQKIGIVCVKEAFKLNDPVMYELGLHLPIIRNLEKKKKSYFFFKPPNFNSPVWASVYPMSTQSGHSPLTSFNNRVFPECLFTTANFLHKQWKD